jgi:hypothetical protein
MIMMITQRHETSDRLNSMNTLQPKQDAPYYLWLIIVSTRKWEAGTPRQPLII